MKHLKKGFGAILLVILLFSVGNLNVQASQNLEGASNNIDLSRETYDRLIEEGILGNDVPFEYWVESNSKSLELEKSFLSEEYDTLFSPFAAIVYKPGDIFITTSTSFNGITGHTGIVIDSKTILHTSGWASEPYPKRISIADWNKRYADTRVTRPKNAALGASAAANAIKYFDGKLIPYKITPGVTDLTNTYCSELVWYSYYKAGLEYNIDLFRPLIIQPYEFKNIKGLQKLNFSYVQ